MVSPNDNSAADPATTSGPNVSVLVVSYQCRPYLEACLESVPAGISGGTCEIVVVDNASNDGSAAMVEARFPAVRLIRATRNEGFARACNRAAAEASAPYLLLLNPDTVVHPGAIDALLAFAAAHPGPGIYGGRTVFADGSVNIASCWGRPTPWSGFCRATGLDRVFRRSELFNPEGIGGWQRDSVREVGYVVGCWMLVETRVWRALSGFDEAFWMYGEDCDLCQRAHDLTGLPPLVTPEAVITHHVGKSSGDPTQRALQIARSRASLIRKYWPRHWQGFGIACEIAYVGLRASVQRLRGLASLRGVDWRMLWRKRSIWRAGWDR